MLLFHQYPLQNISNFNVIYVRKKVYIYIYIYEYIYIYFKMNRSTKRFISF